MTRFAAALAAFAFLAVPVQADDVTDAIQNALEAYNEGDIQYATDELNFAMQLLNEMKADQLVGFLPEPLDGWEREINTEQSAALAVMGGGLGAEAEYRNSSGESFTITIMADNPMVAAMSGMLGNTAMIAASGGKLVRVGREKFMAQDGDLTGLIANRFLIQGSGRPQEAMIDHMKEIDFRALSGFGS